ncbi:MotE family protein [Ancylobacter radicis]|uniref:MotE family protein n=1 Tax=Ancylobacter radicis TaxID=2836179 RepID=A0ABS5RCC4_9HYPH|nr:MotE family protein [Ancylobacter radicis]MBS9479319.1 MotE family protein [Ancylobacter radicis]
MTIVTVLSHLLIFLLGGGLGLMAAALCFAARHSDGEDDEWNGQPWNGPRAVPARTPGLPAPARSFAKRGINLLILTGLTVHLTALTLHGADAESAPAKPAAPVQALPAAAPVPAVPMPSGASNTEQYCQSIIDTARDARFARQKTAIEVMEKNIEERIAQLEAKRAEYEKWLTRREDFLRKADESVIAVISQMRPDAAAAQLTVMADDPAAAILAKLNPRVASAIMNEMDATRAARITGVMVGIAKRAAEAKAQAPKSPDAKGTEGKPS